MADDRDHENHVNERAYRPPVTLEAALVAIDRLRDELHLIHTESSIEGSRIFCYICAQGFSRAEHLERHILTHTGRKPWACRVCYMDFARKDLLKRHLFSVHGCDEDGNPVSPNEQKCHPKTAGRTRSACEACAGSKTKCVLKNQKTGPCHRCVEKGLTCHLKSNPRRQSKLHARREASALPSLSMPNNPARSGDCVISPASLVSPTAPGENQLVTPGESPVPSSAQMSRYSSYDMTSMGMGMYSPWSVEGYSYLPTPGPSSEMLASPVSGATGYNTSMYSSVNRHAPFASTNNDSADVQLTFPDYGQGVGPSTMPQTHPGSMPSKILPTRPMQPALGSSYALMVSPEDAMQETDGYFVDMGDDPFMFDHEEQLQYRNPRNFFG